MKCLPLSSQHSSQGWEMSNDSGDRLGTQEQLAFQAQLLAQLQDGLLALNPQDQIIYCNPAASRLLGFAVSEVVGRSLLELAALLQPCTLIPDNSAHLNPPLSQRLDQALTQSGEWQGENLLLQQREQSLYLDVSVQMLHNEAGQATGRWVMFREVTARYQAELERSQLLQQEQTARATAEAANHLKDEFLAILSHELRTPLNPILGWIQLLRSNKLTAEQAERALATIEQNARLQAQLVEDLLDVSRILRGKVNLSFAPVDLTETIAAAIETVRLSAEAKLIDIHLQLDPAASLVLGSGDRLQQVIWNLMTNAIKFTESGGKITLNLETLTRPGQPTSQSFARITVTDTGRGINPDFLPYVFDYFRQEEEGMTRSFNGLGLGLAIVKYLVELHGGHVQADSPGIGQGATFTVLLPLLSHSPETQFINLPAPAHLSLKGIHVLVVDDDPDTLEFLSFLLTQHDAVVSTVTSAKEGLLLLLRCQPDILISDVGMPEITGYDLIRQIRTLAPEQGGQIPAIALSAYAGERDKQQSLAAGFHIHLPKPVDPDQLLSLILHLTPTQTTPAYSEKSG